MKVFIVRENFKDKKTKIDYKKDDLYNSEESDSKRIEELSSNKNDMKRILIEEKDLTELTVSQLVQYAEIKNIDIKTSILNGISNFNKNNEDSEKGKDDKEKNKK